MIIDDSQVYHIGASLKDLGRKWFAFSKINIETDHIFKRPNPFDFKIKRTES